MRNLIINREHSDIAAKDTYLVYIEDHAVPECKIDGVWVRRLGTIRDGETARFRIADREAMLFVVKNKITRNYSNSCYHIDEGVGGDVFVSGKCEKNMLKFNPFKFDGDASYEVEEFRAKVRKKKTAWFIGILAAFVMISYIAMSGMLASWVDPNRDVYQPNGWSDDAAAKDLGDPNFTVTLNDNFTANFNHQGYYVVFSSEKVTCFVVREPFNQYPDFEKLSLVEYGKKIIEVNKLGEVEVTEKDGVGYFTFSAVSSSNKENYIYYAYLYKSDDACWFVHFAVNEADNEKLADDIASWAASIKINGKQ